MGIRKACVKQQCIAELGNECNITCGLGSQHRCGFFTKDCIERFAIAYMNISTSVGNIGVDGIVRNTQKMKNSCGKFLWFVHPGFRICTIFIARAINLSSANSSTRHYITEYMAPMIPSRCSVDAWGSAKFTDGNHQCFRE